MIERLQKLISQAGIASRRAAEELIANGEVTVNGQIVTELGTKADPVEAAKWYVLSRRAGLTDPALEDFYLGIEESQQKAAIEAANKFRRM